MIEEKNSDRENRQAELLARWLDAPDAEELDGQPDGEPGIDPELLGVIYTLSPKRAPAPRIDLDALIAGVTSGPFAAPPMPPEPVRPEPVRPEPVRPEPVQPRPDPRRAAPTAPRPAPTAPRPLIPRRFLPAMGLVAAAALAAVLVIPVATMYGVTEPNPDVLHAPMPEMASATPPPPAQQQRSIVAEAVSPAAEPVAPALRPVGSPTTGLELPSPVVGPVSAAVANTPAPMPATPATVGVTMPKTEADNNVQVNAPAYGTAATGGATAQIAGDEAPLKDAKENLARLEERTENQADMDDQPIAESAAAKSAPKSAPRSAAESAAGSNKSAPAAPAAEGMSQSYDVPVAQTAPDGAGGGGSVWPLDYIEGWYTRYPDVVPAYQAALQLESARSWPAAAAAWQRLMSDERNDVAQDAAFRAARAWWQSGQSGTALALMEDGLRRSTANTVFRARLYALKADLLASQGKTREAEAARQQAIVLNSSR